MNTLPNNVKNELLNLIKPIEKRYKDSPFPATHITITSDKLNIQHVSANGTYVYSLSSIKLCTELEPEIIRFVMNNIIETPISMKIEDIDREDRKAREAWKILQEYCDNQKNCDGCIFRINDDYPTICDVIDKEPLFE